MSDGPNSGRTLSHYDKEFLENPQDKGVPGINSESVAILDFEENFAPAAPDNVSVETLKQINGTNFFTGCIGDVTSRVEEMVATSPDIFVSMAEMAKRLALVEQVLGKKALNEEEILKEIKMLGGAELIEQEEKSGKEEDPFKLAKELLAITEEEYERIIEDC